MKNVMHWRHTPANKTFVFKTALCYLYCRYIVVVVLVLNENVVVDTIFSHCNFANLFKLFFAYVKMMQFLTLKWHIIPRWKVKLKMGTFTPFFLQYWNSVLPYTNTLCLSEIWIEPVEALRQFEILNKLWT